MSYADGGAAAAAAAVAAWSGRPLAGLRPLGAPDTSCCNRLRSLTSLASSAAHVLAVAPAIPRALGTAVDLLNVCNDC